MEQLTIYKTTIQTDTNVSEIVDEKNVKAEEKYNKELNSTVKLIGEFEKFEEESLKKQDENMIIPLYDLKEMTHLKGIKDHISSKIKQLAFTKFKTLPEQGIK